MVPGVSLLLVPGGRGQSLRVAIESGLSQRQLRMLVGIRLRLLHFLLLFHPRHKQEHNGEGCPCIWSRPGRWEEEGPWALGLGAATGSLLGR